MDALSQTVCWGMAAVTPLMLNSAAGRRVDAIGASAMLLGIWSLGRVLWAFWTPPECLALNPLIDSLAGAAVFTAWLNRREMWKIALCSCFIGQLCLHFDFWVAWPQRANLHNYLALNNTLFAGQLFCVLVPGVLDVARSLRGWMLDRSGGFHHVGPR